ncbi:MAG: 2,3-bisphosphoglycerate-independent phosphoglycerate mutase [Candidatus Omnitrophota bacterium]|jgi:2,3-bisphosphoglycerate-independent phosphoglycerate mutase
MKYIVVAMSGAADQPVEELGTKTPLELAKTPNLHHLAKVGKVGLVRLCSDKVEPTPDVSLLNLLGYDADKVYTGLGPVEAANLDLKLEDNEVAFRMNFITEAEGRLADPTSGRIPTKEARALINFLNKKLGSDFVRFFAGAEYRHVAVIKDSHGFEALSARTHSPEAVTGQPMEDYFPKGPGDELLKKLMMDARLLLQDHEINQVRVDLGENPANMIWLWGQGRPLRLKKFQEMSGLSGAAVAGIEFAKGIARAAGLTVLEVQGATGDLETDYEKKGKMLLTALEEKDFVVVHINAIDEASRRGDVRAKITAIEAADHFLLSKAKKYLEDVKQVRVLVTPCHAALWKTRKRTREAVPFVIAGKNVTGDDIEELTETTAKVSELKMKNGAELLEYLLLK